MKTCVFAGTFDPISRGHEYVVNKCLEIFDKVIIAVGINIDKSPMFSLSERMDIIRATFSGEDRVEIIAFDGMLTEFMKKNDIKFNVRGIRDKDDYKYESTMVRYNQDMFPEMVSLFVPAPNDMSYISSTAIRNIIGMNTDVSKYVPDKAVAAINEIIRLKKQI